MARRSYSELYIHVVWRTKYSRRCLAGDLETFVHRRVREAAEELGLSVLAINSAWDHLHVFLRWDGKVSLSEGIGQMKSCAARDWNRQRSDGDPELRWQLGFGAVSTRRRCVPRVVSYIHQQKRLHQTGELLKDFERTHG